MLHDHIIDGAVFRGTFIEVDYASFLSWHDWGRPEAGVKDCFAQGALRSADGAFLLGVMARHTAHAGQIYFPSGTPDRSDIVGATVDLEGSVWREMREETGLTSADVTAEHGWHTVLAGQRLAHIKVLQARETADALRARILRYLVAATPARAERYPGGTGAGGFRPDDAGLRHRLHDRDVAGLSGWATGTLAASPPDPLHRGHRNTQG